MKTKIRYAKIPDSFGFPRGGGYWVNPEFEKALKEFKRKRDNE